MTPLESANPLMIRDIDSSSEDELNRVTQLAQQTILETLVEARGDPEKVRKFLPNFDFDQMRTMIRNDFGKPTHRFLVAVNSEGIIQAHTMISVKTDPSGQRYGYFFTLHVTPDFRKMGVASRLLKEAELWFRAKKVSYLKAETHQSNEAARRLFVRHGFGVSKLERGQWPTYELRKALTS